MNSFLTRAVALLLFALPTLLGPLGKNVGVATALPAGFRDEGVARIGEVSTISFVPKIDGSDGHVMFATIKDGIIKVVPNYDTSGTSATILDISANVCNNGERGMHQVLPHPNFVTNRWIYVTYTYRRNGTCELDSTADTVNRLTRFKALDDYTLSPESEEVLIETDQLLNKIHNGGDILFGNDGYLYMTIGEDGRKDNAQLMNHVFGKVLRLTDDGNIPSDNPFTGAGTGRCNFGAIQTGNTCQEIYATGFRNPFRFNLNPNTNRNTTEIYIIDVGGKSWEEVSIIKGGGAANAANYGWSDREGPCQLDSYVNCALPQASLNYQDPIYYYQHDSEGSGCITGGVVVPKGIWPSQYDDAFLFFDFVWGKMFSIRNTNNGCRDCIPPIPDWTNTTFQDLIELNVERPVQMVFGPYKNTLALYYTVRSGQQNIRRFIYEGSDNRSPHAEFTASVTSGPVGTTVAFDSSGSNDPDGDDIEFIWDFGDGTTSNEISPSHKFDTTGNFEVVLTVVDEEGFEATANIEVDIGVPPTPLIEVPAPGTTFAVGDVFTLTGSAVDGEGSIISDTSLTWEVKQHHGTHFHPFLDPTTGNKITIDPAPSPEEFLAATTSYLEILLTATDASGFSATVSTTVMPKVVYLGFETNPTGLELLLDGYSVITPVSVATWVNHPLKVDAKDQGGFLFQEWSDGGIASHTVTVGVSNGTYVATFEAESGPDSSSATAPPMSPTSMAPAAPTPAPFLLDANSPAGQPNLTPLGSVSGSDNLHPQMSLTSACLVLIPSLLSLALM